MEAGGISPEENRYNYRERLLKGVQQKDAQTQETPIPIRERNTSAGQASKSIFPAPQDLGEIKARFSRPTDTNYPKTGVYKVVQSKAKDDTWSLESVIRYQTYSSGSRPSIASREKMESLVRKNKRSGAPCPYADKNGCCTAPFIRCGERGQFSVPEAVYQYKMPHACMYTPKKAGKYILIVDDNESICTFCKCAIELFFQYDPDLIITAENGKKAMEKLNKMKIQNKSCGLVICDATLSQDFTGLDVVNTVFRRNYNAGVLLTRKPHAAVTVPREVICGQDTSFYTTIIQKVITKPFHSDVFVKTLQLLDINNLFSER